MVWHLWQLHHCHPQLRSLPSARTFVAAVASTAFLVAVAWAATVPKRVAPTERSAPRTGSAGRIVAGRGRCAPAVGSATKRPGCARPVRVEAAAATRTARRTGARRARSATPAVSVAQTVGTGGCAAKVRSATRRRVAANVVAAAAAATEPSGGAPAPSLDPLTPQRTALVRGFADHGRSATRRMPSTNTSGTSQGSNAGKLTKACFKRTVQRRSSASSAPVIECA